MGFKGRGNPSRKVLVMMDIELGLSFEPKDKKFIEMMRGIQKLVWTRYGMCFFLDASKAAEEKYSLKFTGPSNKMSGWLIAKKDVADFALAYVLGKELVDYKVKRINIWTYWDGEYSGEWIYSFDGAIFGEIDICQL